MAAGAYSSIFIATPLLVHLKSSETEVVLAERAGQGPGAPRGRPLRRRCRSFTRGHADRGRRRRTTGRRRADADERRRRRASPRRSRARPRRSGRGRIVPTAPRPVSQSRGVRPAAADAGSRSPSAARSEPCAGRRRRARGARAAGRRRPGLPRAGDRLQGHHAAARRPRRASPRSSTRWPPPAATSPAATVSSTRSSAWRRAGSSSPPRSRWRSASGFVPGPQGGQAAARDARRLLRAGVRRGDARDAPATASRRGSGCWSSTTCSPPAAPSRATRELVERCGGDGRRGRRADGAGLPARPRDHRRPPAAPRSLDGLTRVRWTAPSRLGCDEPRTGRDRPGPRDARAPRSRRARRRAPSPVAPRSMRARLARMGTRTPARQPGARAAVPRRPRQPPQGRPGAARARLRRPPRRCTAPRCARAATPTSPTRSR